MKTVLLYNFSGERLQKVKTAVMLARAGVKVVEKESYGKRLGSLLGAEGYGSDDADGIEDFNDEMLVMSGFDRDDIDRLIIALRKTGAGRVALKAVVTPTNINWSSSELFRAVKADHEEMQRSKG